MIDISFSKSTWAHLQEYDFDHNTYTKDGLQKKNPYDHLTNRLDGQHFPRLEIWRSEG